MTQKLSAERIKSLLEEPAQALELTDDQLEAALLALAALAGTTDRPGVRKKIEPIYRHAVSRLHPARRLRNYQIMADRVITGQATARTLLVYLACDPDPTLASAAALDYALLAPDEKTDALAGVEFLIDAWQRGGLANGPAVLGGLLLSADRRILALAKPHVRTLSCDEIEELIQIRGRFLSAALVEFYLDWLEQLDSRNDEDLFGAVAAGLANQAIHHEQEPVYDLERVIPATPDEPVRLIDQWTFADYARTIAPRLQLLAAREEGEPIIPEVMKLWGLRETS